MKIEMKDFTNMYITCTILLYTINSVIIRNYFFYNNNPYYVVKLCKQILRICHQLFIKNTKSLMILHKKIVPSLVLILLLF